MNKIKFWALGGILVVSLIILMGLPKLVFESISQKLAPLASAPTAYPRMQAKNSLVGSDVVAKVDGKEIKENELIGSDLITYYGIKQREFEFKKGRLMYYITQYFLDEKTKELGISREEFVHNYIVKNKNTNPSDQELSDFAQEQGLPPLAQIKNNPTALTQITQFLKMRKEFDLIQVEVNKWSKDHQIEYYFARPTIPIDIPTIGSPNWGEATAPVTIVEFADFECPFCAKAASTVMQLKQKYGKKINLVFKNLPFPQHPHARGAALIGLCIYNQAPDKFWDYYKKVYAQSAKLTDNKLREIAQDTKVDMNQLSDCATSTAAGAQVEQDLNLADRLGLESTPMFFINGELINGAAPLEAFSEIIDYYLEGNTHEVKQ